jgi:hypothetical protein
MIEDRRRGAFCLGHFGCFQAEGAANRREPPAAAALAVIPLALGSRLRLGTAAAKFLLAELG